MPDLISLIVRKRRSPEKGESVLQRNHSVAAFRGPIPGIQTRAKWRGLTKSLQNVKDIYGDSAFGEAAPICERKKLRSRSLIAGRETREIFKVTLPCREGDRLNLIRGAIKGRPARALKSHPKLVKVETHSSLRSQGSHGRTRGGRNWELDAGGRKRRKNQEPGLAMFHLSTKMETMKGKVDRPEEKTDWDSATEASKTRQSREGERKLVEISTESVE